MHTNYTNQLYLALILCILLVVGVIAIPKQISFVELSTTAIEEIIQNGVGDKEKNEQPLTMLAFGDMMFDRGVRARMIDGVEPFKFINDFKGSTTPDILTANLEGPIIETARTNCQAKAYSFQFAESMATVFRDVGFNVLNLANNHSYDCYAAGFTNTQEVLKKNTIIYMGGGNTIADGFAVQEINGKNIAFVGIDITVHTIPVEQFYPLITRLKSENDMVIVQIHWGDEYNPSFTSTQQLVGHKLIDAGADVVLGHHPHVIEPLEIYKGKPLFYSLGNFIFDQIGVQENIGLGVYFTFEEKTKINMLPFHIVRSQPQLFSQEEQGVFCSSYLNNISNYKGDGCELVIH